MSVRTVEEQTITAGYPWRLRIKITGLNGAPGPALFPAESAVRVQIRSGRTPASAVLVAISTGNGVTRVSDTEIDLEMSSAQTGLLRAGTIAFFSFVRTDVDPDEALGFWLSVPVRSL